MNTGKVIKFIPEEKDMLLPILRQKVAKYFEQERKARWANAEVRLKIVLIFIVFFGSYTLLLTLPATSGLLLLLGVVWGVSSVLIVFNVSHDAAHGALFRSRRLNRLLTYSFDLVGGNSYLWRLNHNLIHHSYPNVADTDPDIYQPAPLIRVSPAAPFHPYHRFQYWYAPFLYLTHSLYLVFAKDFQDFRLLPKKDYHPPAVHHPRREYLILFGSKLFYLFYTLILPMLVLDLPWQQFLSGYLIVHMAMSLLLSTVLVPVHMVEEATFTPVAEDGHIHKSWTVHVLENTTDYARHSWAANFFLGGLNTHLAHHLFPEVCHVHLRVITDIVAETADELGLNYYSSTWTGAIASHFRLLQKMSRPA